MADKDNPYMQEQVARHGTKPTNGKVLCFFPERGVPLRYAGTFFVMNKKVGRATYQMPAVLLRDGAPVAIDPRAVVFDDGTLALFWHPRLSPAEPVFGPLVQWLAENPGYAVVTKDAATAIVARPPERQPPGPDSSPDFSPN